MKEEIRVLIGDRLRKERERLGFTQDAFAALGSVSLRAEQDWERGLSVPKADFLAVAALNGVDVLYVLTGHRLPTAESTLASEEQALLDNYRSSSPQRRASLREVGAAFAQSDRSEKASGGE